MKTKLLTLSEKIPSFVWQAICLIISIAFYILIVTNRSPNFLHPLITSTRTSFGVTILVATLGMYFAYRIPGKLGQLLGMAATLSLFAMPLAELWNSGQSQPTILNGLIPLYDAGMYYIDALRLMNGEAFSIFSARRPLFAGLLAVLLSITGRNLMVALAIMTAITGLACYFTTREIQRTHGAEIAIFILMVLFLFNRIHSGASMSESLGLSLGTLGFGLLWHSATTRNLYSMCAGLLITTLALNARAGAFLILPILIIWGGWLFREKKLISWKVLFICTCAVVLGFSLNLILTRVIAVPAGVPFANFSYTLYGLASGGKSWAYIFEAHPEILELQEPEQSKRIYQLAFNLILTNPLQTVKGALFNWKMLFSDSWYNIYTYIGGENWKINMISRWNMYILCVIGVFAWFRRPKDPVQSLIMASTIGLFISVPFLPPTDAYRMRPYASSIVILAALPAMGLMYITSHIKTNFFMRLDKILDKNFIAPSISIFSYSFILTFLLLIGPVLIRLTAEPYSVQLDSCASGLKPMVISYDEGTYINIKKQSALFSDWIPNFHIGEFRRNSHSLPDSHLITWANNVEPQNTILLTLDYYTNQKAIVVVPTIILPKTDSFMEICGQWETDPNLSQYDIFYGKEIQILHP